MGADWESLKLPRQIQRRVQKHNDNHNNNVIMTNVKELRQVNHQCCCRSHDDEEVMGMTADEPTRAETVCVCMCA